VECDDERIMHCSDVQGPISQRTLGLMLDFRPNIAIIGGPPFYLSGFRVSETAIDSALRNAEKAASMIPLIIYDHHSLRSEDCSRELSGLKASAERHGHRIVSAAEFSGIPNRLLEAGRRRLYEESPPSGSFQEWARLSKEKRGQRMPPI